MKKLLIGLTLVVIVVATGFLMFSDDLKGLNDYYVQITTKGERIDDVFDNGEPFVDYRYTLTGYNLEGKAKELTFKGNKDRPLRKEAFLKIHWNKKKGVTRYEEVKKEDIPKLAREQLEK